MNFISEIGRKGKCTILRPITLSGSRDSNPVIMLGRHVTLPYELLPHFGAIPRSCPKVIRNLPLPVDKSRFSDPLYGYLHNSIQIFLILLDVKFCSWAPVRVIYNLAGMAHPMRTTGDKIANNGRSFNVKPARVSFTPKKLQRSILLTRQLTLFQLMRTEQKITFYYAIIKIKLVLLLYRSNLPLSSKASKTREANVVFNGSIGKWWPHSWRIDKIQPDRFYKWGSYLSVQTTQKFVEDKLPSGRASTGL
jgi:hypothetical protein